MILFVTAYIQSLIEGVARGSLTNCSMMIEAISNYLFSILCHQDPSILIQVENKLILLCPRCIGLHLGFAISVFLFSVVKHRPASMKTRTLVILSIAVVITAIHWLLGRYSIVEQDSVSRLITGVISGSAIGVLFLYYRSNNIIGSKDCFFQLGFKHFTYSIFVSFIVLYTFRMINNWTSTSTVLVILVLVNFYNTISTIIIRARSLVSFIFSNHSSMTFLMEIHHEHKN